MNPFIALFERPVATLTAGAYVLVLLGALLLSWWALGRNLLYLREQYQNNWRVLVPLWYAVRGASTLGLLALDLLLIGGIVHVVT
jgi:hypothetical protein